MANQQVRHDNYRTTSWREPPVQIPSGSVERDETYGLVSILYHALQGAETYAKYIADAERVGEAELAEFFRECQEQENRRALRAKHLLAMQLEDIDDDEYDEADDEEEEEQ